MDDLKVSDNLKYGKQEILLDPTKEGNKCGSKVTALLLNDLWYKKANGEYITAVAFMLQENISIENLVATVEGQTINLAWQGTNDVHIYTDGSAVGVPPTGDRVHSLALPTGTHTILVQATRDRRGLTKTITITEAGAAGITVEYGD